MNKIFLKLGSQRGSAAIMMTLALTVSVLTLSSAAYQGAIFQEKTFQRDADRILARSLSEAGIQSAMYQIGQNGYTGYINDTDISETTLQSTFGDTVGTYEVDINYEDQGDWVVVTSTATVRDSTFISEAKIFLEAVLSKYAVFITRDTTGGAGLKLGADDGFIDNNGDTIDDTPEGVAENDIYRAKFYYTRGYTFGGDDIDIWGDFYIEHDVAGHSTYTTEIHGDLYVGDFIEDPAVGVVNDGVSNKSNVDIDDGFSDDEDRDGDTDVDADDAPDIHDLTDTGFQDAERKEVLPTVDTSFYYDNNEIEDFNTYANRYIIFEDDGTGDHTVVKELSSSQFSSWRSTGTYSGSPSGTYSLPRNAIVYNNGDLYIGGEITGRVTVVSNDDIRIDDDFTYESGQLYADYDHSAAIIAADKVYLRGNSLNISGMVYAANNGGHTTAMIANQDVNGNTDNSKSYLRFYGNTHMDGTTNTSVYSDRAWIWDSNIMRFRPPGIPIEPELRIVREVLTVIE